MNLFFETENQARAFIAAVPLGFVMAAAFSMPGKSGRFRALLDVLWLLACGASLLMLTVFTRESGLRAYHILALIVGAILYLLGVNKFIIFVKRILQKRKERDKVYET